MDPRAGVDDVEKRKFLALPGLELRTLCRPARSQSLYRLRYPRSCQWMVGGCIFADTVKTKLVAEIAIVSERDVS
jgi:hypothetical protein